MRRLVPLWIAGLALLVAAPSFAGSEHAVSVRGGITVRLPRGWHLVRGRVTDVVIPIPRLAAATFPIRLRAHPCACGLPNLQDPPRAGAFMLIWEWPVASRRQLRRYPARPRRFTVGQENPHWFECAGPSWTTDFRTAGRVFQIEVYLGPGAGSSARSQVDGILDSLRVIKPSASEQVQQTAA